MLLAPVAGAPWRTPAGSNASSVTRLANVAEVQKFTAVTKQEMPDSRYKSMHSNPPPKCLTDRQRSKQNFILWASHWFLPTSMQIQLPCSSVVLQGTRRLETRVAAVPSLKPELVIHTKPASCGFSNFLRVCLRHVRHVKERTGAAEALPGRQSRQILLVTVIPVCLTAVLYAKSRSVAQLNV